MRTQSRVNVTQARPTAEVIAPWAIILLSAGYIINYGVRREWLALGTMGVFFAICIGASIVELRAQRKRAATSSPSESCTP